MVEDGRAIYVHGRQWPWGFPKSWSVHVAKSLKCLSKPAVSFYRPRKMRRRSSSDGGFHLNARSAGIHRISLVSCDKQPPCIKIFLPSLVSSAVFGLLVHGLILNTTSTDADRKEQDQSSFPRPVALEINLSSHPILGHK